MSNPTHEPAMKPKVLVVDDDPDVRRVIRFALEFNGFETLESAEGVTGVALAIEQRPEVALVDLTLDDMPGLAVLDRIRQGSPWTECIVISGNASAATQVANHDPGLFACLTKPFDMRRLAAVVREAADRATRAARAATNPPSREAPTA